MSLIKFSSRSSFKSCSENNNIESDNQFCNYSFMQLMKAIMTKALAAEKEVSSGTEVPSSITPPSCQKGKGPTSTLNDLYITSNYELPIKYNVGLSEG